MYIPTHFRQEDKNSLIKIIQSIKLGVLIIYAENQYFSAHIPFLVKNEPNANLMLEGHVSRANPIWKMASPENKVMVIFRGAEAYIHPGWYPAKAKNGKVVPTWNYQVINCYGVAEK